MRVSRIVAFSHICRSQIFFESTLAPRCSLVRVRSARGVRFFSVRIARFVVNEFVGASFLRTSVFRPPLFINFVLFRRGFFSLSL